MCRRLTPPPGGVSNLLPEWGGGGRWCLECSDLTSSRNSSVSGDGDKIKIRGTFLKVCFSIFHSPYSFKKVQLIQLTIVLNLWKCKRKYTNKVKGKNTSKNVAFLPKYLPSQKILSLFFFSIIDFFEIAMVCLELLRLWRQIRSEPHRNLKNACLKCNFYIFT